MCIRDSLIAMPLLDFYTLPEFDAKLGVWEINENISFFRDRIDLFPEEYEEIEILKARKLLEWYCSRYPLHITVSYTHLHSNNN